MPASRLAAISQLRAYLEESALVARVELAAVRGSSPRGAGTAMFVSPGGICGTIGGGQLEFMAIKEARAMLAAGSDRLHLSVPLGPEIGQCCGGFVEIDVTRMDDDDKLRAVAESEAAVDAYPIAYVFGSGHVGRALARSLSLLPMHVVVVDEREEELALCDSPVRKRLSVLPEEEVRMAPPGSAFVILTHDHATDFMIAAEALARGDAAYVGMIGSRSKRAKFASWCEQNIDSPPDTARLVCPIGAFGLSDKRPEVISAFVAAEIVLALQPVAGGGGPAGSPPGLPPG